MEVMLWILALKEWIYRRCQRRWRPSRKREFQRLPEAPAICHLVDFWTWKKRSKIVLDSSRMLCPLLLLEFKRLDGKGTPRAICLPKWSSSHVWCIVSDVDSCILFRRPLHLFICREIIFSWPTTVLFSWNHGLGICTRYNVKNDREANGWAKITRKCVDLVWRKSI